MAKTLKSISFTLLPNVTGAFEACNATYLLGSTDDPSLVTSKAMTLDLDKSEPPQLQKFWAEWVSLIKAKEGIK